MAIIELKHASKEYKLGQIASLKETLKNLANRICGGEVSRPKRIRALDDVSLQIERGEVVGIIGQNGAGKSTLLKMLARISVLTEGELSVQGSVAPLIEVGAGLHPELTGKENVFLNGSILGIPRSKIRRKLGDIIAFAELEDFVDTPLKRYSSGMRVRLGFAIAASVEADILIVDEVLAVGDLSFQRRCFDRMEALIRRSGRTVLIVSHNIRQIQRLCNRVILMDHGKILMDGDPATVCNKFYESSNERVLGYAVKETKRTAPIESSGEIDVKEIVLFKNGGDVPADCFKTYDPMRIRIAFHASHEVPASEVIMGFHTTDFVYISSASSSSTLGPYNIAPGVNYIEFALNEIPLSPGVYCIRIGFNDRYSRRMWYGENLKAFRIDAADDDATKNTTFGVVELPFKVSEVSASLSNKWDEV